MADEEEDGGDYLEQEKKRDHLEKITKYMEEDLKLRKAQAAAPTEYVLSAATAHIGRPLTMSVRKIENGWILATAKEDHRLGHGGYGDEIFCQTAGELVKVAAARVEAFAKQEVAGTLAQGPPPLYMEPGEAI